MKSVRVERHEDPVLISTNSCVLDAVLATREKLLMACGGKGLCATCHVYVTSDDEPTAPLYLPPVHLHRAHELRGRPPSWGGSIDSND